MERPQRSSLRLAASISFCVTPCTSVTACTLDEEPLPAIAVSDASCECDADGDVWADSAVRDTGVDSPPTPIEVLVDPLPVETGRERWPVTGVTEPGATVHVLDQDDVELVEGTASPEGNFRLEPSLPVDRRLELTVRAVAADGLSEALVTNAWNGGLLALTRSSGYRQFSVDDQALAAAATSRGFGGAVADADADGDLDFFLSTGSLFLENDGSGLFRDLTAIRAPGGLLSSDGAAWVDFDRDGDLDLATSTQYGEFVWLHQSGPDGTLTEVGGGSGLRPAPGAGGYALAWVDVQEDGWADLILLQDGLIAAYLWDGVTFSVAADGVGLNPAPGALASRLATGDVDFDGLREIAILSTAPNSYFHAFPGGFEPVSLSPEYLPAGSELVGHEYAVFSDLDDDGDVDLLAVVPGQSFAYENDGLGSLVAGDALVVPPLGTTVDLAAADLDADGRADVLSPAESALTGVTRTAAGDFVAIDPSWGLDDAPASDIRAVIPADVDGDGDVDIIVLQAEGSHFLLRNSLDLATWFLKIRVDAPGALTGGAVRLFDPSGQCLGARVLGGLRGKGVQEPDEAVFAGIAASWPYRYEVILPGVEAPITGTVVPMTDGRAITVAP